MQGPFPAIAAKTLGTGFGTTEFGLRGVGGEW